MALQINKNSIYVFVDDSGTPSTPKNQPLFQLGGCILHGSQMPIINDGWEQIKEEVFGDKKFPFHASSDEVKKLSDEHKQKFFNFFDAHRFGRFSVGYNLNFNKQECIQIVKEGSYEICILNLLQNSLPKILKYYSKWYISSNIVIIFEDCERDRDSLNSVVNRLKSEVSPKIKYPIEYHISSKTQDLPCLEIADLISNKGYQAWRALIKQKQKDPEYTAEEEYTYGLEKVFPRNDELVYSLLMNEAQLNAYFKSKGSKLWLPTYS